MSRRRLPGTTPSKDLVVTAEHGARVWVARGFKDLFSGAIPNRSPTVGVGRKEMARTHRDQCLWATLTRDRAVVVGEATAWLRVETA